MLSNRKRWHALLVWLARCLQVGMTHTEYQDRNNEYGRVEHLGSCCWKRCQAAMTSCHQTYIMSRNSCLQITCHSLMNGETGMSHYTILQKMWLKSPILWWHITLGFELYSYFDHNLAVTLITSTVHISGTLTVWTPLTAVFPLLHAFPSALSECAWLPWHKKRQIPMPLSVLLQKSQHICLKW